MKTANHPAPDRSGQALADRIRAYLGERAGEGAVITYGQLARALAVPAPGSIRKVTEALETTMTEDARAGRPFIAACVVARGAAARPAPGFFAHARGLGCGPRSDESEDAFHARHLAGYRTG